MPSIGHLIFKMISFVLLNNGYKKKSWRRFERLSFFSVCADEAADSSNKVQLSLVLWFVDKTGVVREESISVM